MSRRRNNNLFSKTFHFLLLLFLCYRCCNFCSSRHCCSIFVNSFQVNNNINIASTTTNWQKTTTTTTKIKPYNFFPVPSQSRCVRNVVVAIHFKSNNYNDDEEEILISSLPEITKKNKTKTTKNKNKNKKTSLTKPKNKSSSTESKKQNKSSTTTIESKQTKKATASSTTSSSTTASKEKQKRRRTWDESFERLKAYKQQHGNCLVPTEYKDDKQLGLWVRNQRKLNKQSTTTKLKLKQERKDKLNEIGFCWEAFTDNWNTMYQQLQAFQEQYGHCNVEQIKKKREANYSKSSRNNNNNNNNNNDNNDNHNTNDNQKLALWVQNQRAAGVLLSKERRSKLDQLGFVWNNVQKVRVDQQWEERYQLLQEYKHIHGDTLVPKNWSSEEKNGNIIKLGLWVSRQRQYYQQNILQEDREAKLNNIGFVWKVQTKKGNRRRQTTTTTTDFGRMDKLWMERLETLKEFQKNYNHTNVPKEYKEHSELGQWVYAQRQQYRLGLLKEHRYQLLHELGFEWKLQETTFQQQWMDQYQNLIAFQQEYGDTTKNEGVSKSTHPELYAWLRWQRTLFANDKLELDRKELLENIGVDLNAF